MKTVPAMGRKSACFLLLLAFLLLLSSQWVSAADWYIVPRIDLRPEYDSNINWNFEDKQSDFIFNIDPSLDVNYESNISKFRGRVLLNGQIFADNSYLDTINQYYWLNGQHKMTPRFGLTFDGSFSSDSRLRTELEAAGTTLTRTRRQALRVGPGIIYDLTPRLAAGLKYGYGNVTYQDPRYSDYYEHGAEVSLRHLLRNQKTSWLTTVTWRYVKYPDINNLYRNLGFLTGIDHKFSEEWGLLVTGGLNFNWFNTQTAVIGTEFDPVFIQVPLQQVDKSFTVSPAFLIQGRRIWPRTNLNFGYGLNQYPSGSGAIRQFHNLTADITRALGQKFRVSLAGYARYSFTSSDPDPFDDRNESLYFDITPGITYQINNKLSLSGNYSFGWRRDVDENLETPRHRVMVFLTFAYPLEYKK